MRIEGWPRCAKCNKPVERVIHRPDLLRDTHEFEVLCHDERQKVSLHSLTMLQASAISFGIAFCEGDVRVVL